MRIQETHGILKESRLTRSANAENQHEDHGLMSRAWRMVSTLPGRITGMFKR